MSQNTRYTKTVEPEAEPLSTDDAKDHLCILNTDHDGTVDTLIVAAREFVENVTNRTGNFSPRSGPGTYCQTDYFALWCW